MTQTIDALLWTLWERCLVTAREADYAPADAVEQVIRESRAMIAKNGYSKRESDYILFDVYTQIHWDWQRPTDRVFETLLEFELDEFFKERTAN
jgi:hypothetical protein